ncbi:MAG: formyltransferase family protein [bacterium]
MTNPTHGNNFVKELIDSKLFPILVVTKTPFYFESRSVLIRGLKKTELFFKYVFQKKQFQEKYLPYFMARKYNLPTYDSRRVNSESFYNMMKEINIDYIFTFSFEIISEKIFESPKLGAINFHPSFLPENKGATPTNWAILLNTKTSGVTFHYISKEIDGGKIIERYKVSLSGYETAEILNHYLLSLGSYLFVRLIYKLKNGITNTTSIEVNEKGYYNRPFKKKHSILEETNTLNQIDCIVRAARISGHNALYNLNDFSYEITNCVDITSIPLSMKNFPHIDENGNIYVKTSDDKIGLLITKR